jgi:hypothetical protein
VNPRVVIPELLDHLPMDDPEAVRSRRDLQKVNALMGNEHWICRNTGRFSEATDRGIVEIGAGDGSLCTRLAKRFLNAPVAAYDLAPRPAGLLPRILWHQGDLFEVKEPPAGGVLIANLFLHHFEEDALAELGHRWVAGFEVVIFNEPDRARVPHVLGNLMHPWINQVTRHDLHASINAGFAAGEMARSLNLDPSHWKIEETSTWRGARRVLAWQT